MVAHLDQVTGYIQEQLELHNLTSRANVVHLSDHGMAGVKPPKFINLTEIIVPYQYDYYGSSPVLQIVPKDCEYFSVHHLRTCCFCSFHTQSNSLIFF